MKRLLGLVAGAVAGVFLLGTGPAFAVGQTLGTLDINHPVAFSLNDTDFGPSDTYSFHLDGDAAIFASASALISSTTGVTAMSIDIGTRDSHGNFVSIWDVGGPNSVTLNSLNLSNSVLSAGDYIMSIAGLRAPGATSVFIAGFITAISPSLAATPIPATGLMMLTAFGALGLLVVRRKRGGVVFASAVV